MTVTERACALSADAFTTLQQRGGTLPARPAKKAGYLTEHPLTLRLLGYLPQEGELATDAELVTLPLARVAPEPEPRPRQSPDGVDELPAH